MVRHRANLRDRVRTWWDERSVHPLVLPIVWVGLSALLLIGLALIVPPIIHDIIEPKAPEKTTQQTTPSPKQSLPPVLQVPTAQPRPEATQEPVPGQAPQPVAPKPQAVPQPVAPQPVQPVQPFQPQPVPQAPQPVPAPPAQPQPQPVPQVPQLPPVLQIPKPQPLPSLPVILKPVVPPILGPVLEKPVKIVDKIVGGTLDTVDKTVDGVTGVFGGLLR